MSVSSVNPVSYTHLDVYKRQALYQPGYQPTEPTHKARHSSGTESKTGYISWYVASCSKNTRKNPEFMSYGYIFVKHVNTL